MAQPARALFYHRQNKEGSYDSICTVCMTTVATVRNEEGLCPRELVHVCNPIRLYQVREGLVRHNSAE